MVKPFIFAMSVVRPLLTPRCSCVSGGVSGHAVIMQLVLCSVGRFCFLYTLLFESWKRYTV